MSLLFVQLRKVEKIPTRKLFIFTSDKSGRIDRMANITSDKSSQRQHAGIFNAFGKRSHSLPERISSHHWIWRKDDSTLAVALLTIICGTAMGFPASFHGMGRDASDLSVNDISMVRLLVYCEEILYGVAITLVRLSALFFYLRVFPQIQFRSYVYAMIIFDMLFGLAYNLAFAFQCWPVDNIWSKSEMARDSACVNVHVLALSGSIINMLQDLMVVVLPTPILCKLSLPVVTKIQVLIMFSSGILVTIISAVRLRYIASFNATSDPTPEVSAGAVCSCLPSVRRLVVRVRATGKAGSASNYENSVPIPMGRMRIENTGSGCVPLSDELAGDKVASDRGSDNESEIKLISAKNLA
ncbi:hypothetical protein BJ166DRAFT_503810 [Pestalotiopsis sp. NC0098]|nr:hypothetical protein BJ166DRAFT_503810 [Pestalotiopsis sp. NC0098]